MRRRRSLGVLRLLLSGLRWLCATRLGLGWVWPRRQGVASLLGHRVGTLAWHRRHHCCRSLLRSWRLDWRRGPLGRHRSGRSYLGRRYWRRPLLRCLWLWLSNHRCGWHPLRGWSRGRASVLAALLARHGAHRHVAIAHRQILGGRRLLSWESAHRLVACSCLWLRRWGALRLGRPLQRRKCRRTQLAAVAVVGGLVR